MFLLDSNHLPKVIVENVRKMSVFFPEMILFRKLEDANLMKEKIEEEKRNSELKSRLNDLQSLVYQMKEAYHRFEKM